MTIEEGDFFVIERGPMMRREIISKDDEGNQSLKQVDDVEMPFLPGTVLMALAVDGDWIASEIVWVPPYPPGGVGIAPKQRLILRASKLVLCALGKDFMQKLVAGPSPRRAARTSGALGRRLDATA